MNSIKKTISAISVTSLFFCTFYLWNHIHTQPHKNSLTVNQYPIVSTSMPLVVILMVKNEADFMAKTLMPFIEAGVDGYLVLDTGSTDETIIRTQQLFKDHAIEHGYIIEQPFIDFASSRNYALECAEQLFPHATFFFMIDAEWYTQNVPLLLKYCNAYAHEPIEALKILIHYKNKEYYVGRILKADKKVRFASVVHEYPQIKTCAKLPSNIYVAWDDSDKGFEKSKERWKHDIKLLLKQHQQNPNDLRTLYYIGQTYSDLKEFDNAITWYKKRYENKDGWLEERILSCYNIARIYDVLQNWPQALYYYLESYNLDHNRAEALIAIAQHYLKTKDYYNSFLFAQKAALIHYPPEAISITPEVYLYTRYDILAAAAWNIGEYEIGENALKVALKNYPQDQHLLKNLKAYQDRKNK